LLRLFAGIPEDPQMGGHIELRGSSIVLRETIMLLE